MGNTYHYKDTIGKRSWRSKVVDMVMEGFPVWPKNSLYVTLGGLYTDESGKIIPNSEIDKLTAIGSSGHPAVPPELIISVECNPEVYQKNQKNKAGIRCIYAPLTHKQDEGKNCPVKWGELGGIAKTVKDLRQDGKIIGAVNADFQGTYIGEFKNIHSLAKTLSYQKEKALLFVNLLVNMRGAGGGKATDVFKYIRSHERHLQKHEKQFRRHRHNAAIWRPMPFTLCGGHTYEYVSSHGPMETIFLEKINNPGFKGGYYDNLSRLFKKGQTGKNPNRVAGANKYWDRVRAGRA